MGNKFYASVSTGNKEEVLMPPEDGGRVLFVRDTESIVGRHIPVYLMGALAAIGLVIAGSGVRKLLGGVGWSAG